MLDLQGSEEKESIIAEVCCTPRLAQQVLSCPAADDQLNCAQQGVCEELDQLRALFDDLPDLLTRVVEAELSRIPASVAQRNVAQGQLWSIQYLPQVGCREQVATHLMMR